LKPRLTDVKRVQALITGLTRFKLSLTVSTVLTLFNLNEARYGTVQGIFYGRYRQIQAKLAVQEFPLPFILPFVWMAHPCSLLNHFLIQKLFPNPLKKNLTIISEGSKTCKNLILVIPEFASSITYSRLRNW
jgi:hypothetical protein